ncbi:hypothetical protein DL239_11795 [Sedimentitalea sp. CY04]|uniref:Uncharacterized protein n=1 Tax=Parasedimentitalea denitrificans TaxID=2211118 RepID=A0ABX0W891_9RHOB|nr:hypothetical protein [Sedimentitalea sp. CY04]NIZ61656.1 hypothetical protein [Sedimentitalea sp. CY04]
MRDKSTEMIAQFTASKTDVDYSNVMDTLFSRNQEPNSGGLRSAAKWIVIVAGRVPTTGNGF